MAASNTVSRAGLRALQRASRCRRSPITRSYATETQQASAGTSPAVLGGLIGGSLVFLGGYSWYHFSGAKTAVNSLRQTKQYFDQATQKLQDSAPAPNEAIQWLRSTAQSYAAFIPGAKGYVDSAFNDLDAIHEKHGDQVDKIVRDTYEELKDVTKSKGASMETAAKAWEILQRRVQEIGELAGDAAEQIMQNHPQLKEKVGGNIDQLKEMGHKYGPEAKEQVDKTWQQVRSILSGGIGVGTINEIRKVVQEKTELLQKMGEDAYKKAMDEAKPYLEKSPKVKEILEENADALKRGNVGELFSKVKSAVESGDTDDLEKFVKSSADKAKSMSKGMGSDMESYLKMIPGADQIAPKLKQLQELGEKHGKEAEDILKSTISEIQQVLSRKMQDAEKVTEKVKEDAK